MGYKTQNNFSIERTLSPRNLDSDLREDEEQKARAFFRTYSGREALLKQLDVLRYDLQEMNTSLSTVFDEKYDDKQASPADQYIYRNLNVYYEDALSACNNLINALLCLDTKDIGDQINQNILARNPAKARRDKAEEKAQLLQSAQKEPDSFFARIKGVFNDTIDDWRGYTPEAKRYNKADEAFYQYMQNKAEEKRRNKVRIAQEQSRKVAEGVTNEQPQQPAQPAQTGSTTVAVNAEVQPQNFSNRYGVKNMKFNSRRRAFSNAEACDMLANKLTNDWFICEPHCQPLISEALKSGGVDCTSIAPALNCNVMQLDGEAPVSKSELAALDKVQMFIQALKDEIACGRGGCEGITLVPEAKAFSLKKKLKRQLRCFADIGEIEPEEIGTPEEIIEAEEAGIDIDNPEKYEFVADQAEAGNIPPEVMDPEAAAANAAPSVMAPSSMDLNEMGYAYDHVLDSTIADNGTGIGQSDWSAYDSKPGELSLSAANVGEAMAQMNEDAFVVGEEEGMMPAPITADMAAGQNFSRSLYRRNAAHKNFSVKRTVSRPANSTRGLRNLLGDKYLR